VLWDNSTRFIFTLAAGIIGLIAYFLIPNRNQIGERTTGSYERTGRWLLFAFAFVLIGLAGVLAWEWFRYKVHDIWVGGNLVLYAFLGPALLVVNILTIRAVKRAAAQEPASHVGVVAAEIVEVSAVEGTRPGAVQEEAPAVHPPNTSALPDSPGKAAGEAPKP
jgi:hypothetical protein